MTIQSEKENINKIRERMERIEALRTQIDAEYEEIKALLRKRYDLTSDRTAVAIFKSEIKLTRWGGFDRARAMIKEDRIVYDRTTSRFL